MVLQFYKILDCNGIVKLRSSKFFSVYSRLLLKLIIF